MAQASRFHFCMKIVPFRDQAHKKNGNAEYRYVEICCAILPKCGKKLTLSRGSLEMRFTQVSFDLPSTPPPPACPSLPQAGRYASSYVHDSSDRPHASATSSGVISVGVGWPFVGLALVLRDGGVAPASTQPTPGKMAAWGRAGGGGETSKTSEKLSVPNLLTVAHTLTTRTVWIFSKFQGPGTKTLAQTSRFDTYLPPPTGWQIQGTLTMSHEGRLARTMDSDSFRKIWRFSAEKPDRFLQRTIVANHLAAWCTRT